MAGIIISKDDSNVYSLNPEDFVLDTREIGGMKCLGTFHFGQDEYTELYRAPGPIPGTTFTYGRIRIEHNLDYPPAHKGYLVAFNQVGDGVPPVRANPLPTNYGNGAVVISSNKDEVIVEGCPVEGTAGGPYYVTVVVFMENLDSDVI